MASQDMIPFKFELKWLIGPFAIILLASALILFFPEPAPAPVSSGTPGINPEVSSGLGVAEAKMLAREQCALTFDCTQTDCLEKLLTQVDSASTRIDAILRTPAPRAFRDRLRQAIKRGVEVRLVLDSSLNPQFYLEGAQIRIKTVNKFVATNFLIVDGNTVIYGTDPQTYAQAPDIIQVACVEKTLAVYQTLFERVWGDESASFVSETTEEEAVGDDALLLDEGGSCSQSACGPDTFTCVGTTKVWQDYFCDGSACVYQIIPLYFSYDCGYNNPGFGEGGEPLVVISEVEVDEGALDKEFVEFLALQSLELTGFTLLQNGTPLITFPEPYILDGAARVYTKEGTNSNTIVYLNLQTTLWNTPGTVATLVNPFGDVVAERVFE